MSRADRGIAIGMILIFVGIIALCIYGFRHEGKTQAANCAELTYDTGHIVHTGRYGPDLCVTTDGRIIKEYP